jgi:hypothetical protein
MKCAVFAVALVSLLSCPTAAAPVTLACRLASTTEPNDRMNSVDRVVIDVEAKRVEALSSSTGDAWAYNDNGLEGRGRFFDGMASHRFEDGRLFAAGIRMTVAYGFEYDPRTGVLVHNYTNYGKPVSINYRCHEI